MRRWLLFKVCMISLSASVSWKSKMSKFSIICFLLVAFGITIAPFWSWNGNHYIDHYLTFIPNHWLGHGELTVYRRMICAGVFTYLLASSETLRSEIANRWPPGVCGLPNGENAVIVMFLAAQNLINFCWFRFGWHSTCNRKLFFYYLILHCTLHLMVIATWLVTGFIMAFDSIRSICSLLKFDRPILRTRPLWTNFSIAFHVSTKSISSLAVLPGINIFKCNHHRIVIDYYLVAYRIAELQKKRDTVFDLLRNQCLHHFQMGTDKMHSHRPQEDGCSQQLDCTLLGNAISINRCSLNPSSRMTVEKLSPHTRHREMCSTTVFEFNLRIMRFLF